MGQGASETDVSVDLSPEPMSAATGEPKRPEPLVDEDVLTLALRQLVDDYLAAHPWMVWRRAVGYIVNVEGQWRKLSKRKYLSSVAAHCRRNGYIGIMPAPELGEHTAEILGRVGVDDARLAALKAAGVA